MIPCPEPVEKAGRLFRQRVFGLMRAVFVHLWRTKTTLSDRDVFSAMYTPRRKMIFFFFAAAAAKLYEVFEKLRARNHKP